MAWLKRIAVLLSFRRSIQSAVRAERVVQRPGHGDERRNVVVAERLHAGRVQGNFQIRRGMERLREYAAVHERRHGRECRNDDD